MAESAKLRDLEYTIEYVTADDTPAVAAFLRENFFKYEPLNGCLNLSEKEILTKSSRAGSCIPENCSFKAVRKNGEILGIALNEFLAKSDFYEEIKNQSEQDNHNLTDKTKTIRYMMEYIAKECDIFKLYPKCDRILDNRLLGTRSDCFGMGIGRKLLQRSIDYQQEHRLELFKIVCSNRQTARLSVALGFEKIYEIYCKDYVVNGVQPLMPAPPHDLVDVFVRKLD